jgi:virginiamycin B lyase
VRRALLAALLCVIALPASAGAATITEFVIPAGTPPSAHAPLYIQPGPGGALWFTDQGGEGSLGRILPSGEVLAPIPRPAMTGIPRDLVVDPGGTVYWTSDTRMARRLPDGTVEVAAGESDTGPLALSQPGYLVWVERALSVCRPSEGIWGAGATCTLPEEGMPGQITDLTAGADGRLWSVYSQAGLVRRQNLDGLGSDLEVAVPDGPARIALGPDGNMWVTVYNGAAVDRITPTGVRTRFPLLPGSRPIDIVSGPDGALWIADSDPSRILRVSTGGSVRAFPTPTPAAGPVGITAGPDGALWFTEQPVGRIGRLVLDGTEGAQDVRGPAGGGSRGGSGGGTGGSGARERIAPRFLRAAALAPAQFRAGTTSRLTFALSEAGRVRIAIERPLSGRRVDGRCVQPSRRNRSRPRCTRYATVATLLRDGVQGLNTVTFSGRVNRRALAARRYRISVTVTDAAGNRSPASRANFTILRR